MHISSARRFLDRGLVSLFLVSVFGSLALAQDKPKIDVVPQLGHPAAIHSVAFSLEGAHVLTGGDKTTKLWDASSGKLLRTFEGGAYHSVAFSPDGLRVLTGSFSRVQQWDARTGMRLKNLEVDSSLPPRSVAFSPDGGHMLTGGEDDTATLWNAGSGKRLKSFTGHTEDVVSVAFSPNGDRVLTGSDDETAKLWDAASGKLLQTFKGHSGSVAAVAVSPDSTWVLTGSNDETAKLWDAATGKLLQTFKGPVGAVAVFPDGNWVLTVGGSVQSVKLWDVATGRLLRTFEGHPGRVAAVAVSPDGNWVLTGGGIDQSAKLWDAATGQLVRTFAGSGQLGNLFYPAAFSPSGAHVLTGSWDDTAKLWDAATGKLLRTFEGHSESVLAVAVSTDGARVLTGSRDGTAKLWDADTGKLLLNFKHPGWVNSVAFSADGTELLTGNSNFRWSLDSKAVVNTWNANTGKLLATIKVDGAFVLSAAFSPDATRIVTSGGRKAELWDSETGKLLTSYSENVVSVAFSPNGGRVLTGNGDGTMTLWDAGTGRLLKTFSGHSDGTASRGFNEVISLAFSNSGAQMVTGSRDGTAKLWDVGTGTHIRTFEVSSAVESVAISTDGTRVLTGDRDGAAKLWGTASGQELVTMIGGADGAWLTLTPTGFFIGPRDADKILAIVQGLEPFSVTQFFEHLYRPDLVAEALKGDPERKYKNAASKLNLETILDSGDAPEIQFIPGKKTELIGDSIVATVRIVDTGGGIGDKVVWRLNGITKEISRKSRAQDDGEPWVVTETLTVNPTKKNTIEVTAYNGAGLLATEPFRFEVDKFGTSTEEAPRPTMYVLALGVSDYVRNDWDLNYAMTDAETIGDRLKRAAKDLYKDVQVTVLKDRQVTQDGIDAVFKTLKAKVQPTDVFVLFVAGHGRNVTGTYYFLPHDLTFEGGKSVEDGIGQDTWQSWLKLIAAEKSILIFDTCESSAAAGLTRGEQERETAVDRLRHATGRSIITAARQAAYEGYKGHGVLTYAILDAFKAKKGRTDEEVDLYQLASHVDREVPEISHSLFGVRQRPHNKIEGNFPLGIRQAALETGGKGDPIPTEPTHVLVRSELVREKPEAGAPGNRTLVPGTQVRAVEFVGAWVIVAREGQKLGYVPVEALARMQ